MIRIISILSFAVVFALLGCNKPTSDKTDASAQKAPGMTDFDYLACDGGPHLVLPKELSGQWKGSGSMLAALGPSSDVGKAFATDTNLHMALISVGSGQSIVLADPPLSAWGRSPEGWIDIYNLQAWPDMNLDAMVKRSVATIQTKDMVDTGKMITLTQPGLVLLYAGDKPGSATYGEFEIPIDAGIYNILEGHYKASPVEEVYIYRLRPKSANNPLQATAAAPGS